MLATISKALKSREIEEKEKVQAIQKMDKIFKDLKQEFEENLQSIKNSENFVLENEPTPPPVNDERNNLQEDLLDSVNVREVIDMHEFVNERQKNIQEISRALSVVHTMSNQMLELTISDGLKLEGILKEHKQHQEVVEKQIMPELAKTKAISQKQMKQTCLYGVIAIILALCIAGLAYEIAAK